MRYTNYPRQRYGYGEPQMTRKESEQMSGADKKIVAVWSVLVAALVVAALIGFKMRGVL